MFTFTKLSIPDVLEITSTTMNDERGFFEEIYKESVFKEHHMPTFVQENHSFSKKHVLRGLHFQNEPYAQGKLIRCIRGEIFDVAVDMRQDSPTRYRWVGVTLSDTKNNQLYIPEGFAHGFCVLSEEAEVVYKCTKEYTKESEGGILWNDSKINITWPISNPILSKKDAAYHPLQ